ncbi:MAG: glutaredoxin family protein [Methylotenera sp.]
MTVHLNLYSTSHCHLCEQAGNLLMSLSDQYDIQWMNIEITDDLVLLENYGSKIPVLKRLDTNVEIAWPFSIKDIEKFLHA